MGQSYSKTVVREIITNLLLLILVIASIISVHFINMLYIKNTNHISYKDVNSFFSVHDDRVRPELNAHFKQDEFSQTKDNTCALAALKYLLTKYGIDYSENELVGLVKLNKDGTSMYELVKAVDKLGFIGTGAVVNYQRLEQMRMPVIAFINNNHFVVIESCIDEDIDYFDPSPGRGIVCMKKREFEEIWDGVVLQVKTKPLKLIE